MAGEDNPNDFLEELFGPVIFSYGDSDAISDGVLIPFVTPQGRDTKHRMTNNAFNELKEHYRPSYPEYQDGDFYRFFFNELLSLVPEAYRQWDLQEVLTTNYDFAVERFEPGKKQLWYIPNEVGGVTAMKPDDY